MLFFITPKVALKLGYCNVNGIKVGLKFLDKKWILGKENVKAIK